MIDIAILGSTGSIGTNTLKSISSERNFKIKLLSTNKNIKKLYQQAKKFNVKDVIINDKKIYLKNKKFFKKKKINSYYGFKNINKIIKKKLNYSINSISGIDGLEPTLELIPHTKNILIANKESSICGWNIISKKLKYYKTNFIPIDSEHYSISELIKNEPLNTIDKIILTASGGPFLNKSFETLSNIKPKNALKHPKWKMGKKISIDSSTMMNKIFEFIEAKKIFNLKNKDIRIVIHPDSFIHAVVFFKGGLIKLLAHETNMQIPISNALGIKKTKIKNIKKYIINLNNSKFDLPNNEKFPLLNLIKLIPDRTSYFETILTTLNDNLVDKYLNGHINYKSIHKNLLILIKKPFFKKYYKLKPMNIYDINNIIMITKKYLDQNFKYYE